MTRGKESEVSAGVGGKRSQESGRIPIEGISPSSMATFLERADPSLKFDQDPGYSQIFCNLRKLPFREQENLLVGFYTQGVETFPNGAKLGRFLASINNIHWFTTYRYLPNNTPRLQYLTPNSELLGQLSHQVFSRLNSANLPLEIIEFSDWRGVRSVAQKVAEQAVWYPWWPWGETPEVTRGAGRGAARAWGAAREVARATRGAAWEVARKTTQKAIEYVIWNAAEHMSSYGVDWSNWGGVVANASMMVARHATQDAEWDAACCAEWIVVEDLMPQRGYRKGNPFKPLMGIYELGCWPIGIVSDRTDFSYWLRKKKFVVFIPPSF